MYNATATPQPPRGAGGAPRAKAERALPARGRGEPAEAPGREGSKEPSEEETPPATTPVPRTTPGRRSLKRVKGHGAPPGTGVGKGGGRALSTHGRATPPANGAPQLAEGRGGPDLAAYRRRDTKGPHGDGTTTYHTQTTQGRRFLKRGKEREAPPGKNVGGG